MSEEERHVTEDGWPTKILVQRDSSAADDEDDIYLVYTQPEGMEEGEEVATYQLVKCGETIKVDTRLVELKPEEKVTVK